MIQLLVSCENEPSQNKKKEYVPDSIAKAQVKVDSILTIYRKGELLFKPCSSCHAVSSTSMNKMAPDLHGISNRLSKDKIRRWIRNSSELIASGDPYANELYRRYGKSSMTAFPSYTDEDIDALLLYIETRSVSNRKGKR